MLLVNSEQRTEHIPLQLKNMSVNRLTTALVNTVHELREDVTTN